MKKSITLILLFCPFMHGMEATLVKNSPTAAEEQLPATIQESSHIKCAEKEQAVDESLETKRNRSYFQKIDYFELSLMMMQILFVYSAMHYFSLQAG